MPDHKGYRAGTRHLFRKKIHGMPKPTKYLQFYKIGQFVTIMVDSAIHRGMPHRIYHGKTGIVWNITRRSVGVLLKRRIGNRYVSKRLSIRHEHVKPSGCRKDLERRNKFRKEYMKKHMEDPKKC